MVLTSVLVAISVDGGSQTLITSPSPVEYDSAKSVHVLAFTSQGDLLLAESQGAFDLEDWDEVHETAKTLCLSDGVDTDMQGGVKLENAKANMLTFVKSALEEKVVQDLHWHR